MAYKGSVIVTGGTLNMGYHTALKIAKEHPEYLVVVASRSDRNHAADTINKTLNQANTIFRALDLSDTKSVRAFASSWIDDARPPIKSLVCNAALQFPDDMKLSVEGVEMTFAIAHLGHALLFHLLYPYMDHKGGSRVVVVSSGTHDPAQKSGLPDAEFNTAEALAHPPPDKVNINGRGRYSTAKLCNVLWTYALHRRLQEKKDSKVTVNAFDPGLMPGSDLAREAGPVLKFIWYKIMPHTTWLLKLLVSPNIHTPAESGASLARLAVGKDLEGVSGKYFEGRVEIKSSVDSYVEAKQEELWNWTIEYCTKGSEEEKRKFQALE